MHQCRDTHRRTDGSPVIGGFTEMYKEVTWKQGIDLTPELSPVSAPDRYHGKVGAVTLAFKVFLRQPFFTGLGINQIPVFHKLLFSLHTTGIAPGFNRILFKPVN